MSNILTKSETHTVATMSDSDEGQAISRSNSSTSQSSSSDSNEDLNVAEAHNVVGTMSDSDDAQPEPSTSKAYNEDVVVNFLNVAGSQPSSVDEMMTSVMRNEWVH